MNTVDTQKVKDFLEGACGHDWPGPEDRVSRIDIVVTQSPGSTGMYSVAVNWFLWPADDVKAAERVAAG